MLEFVIGKFNWNKVDVNIMSNVTSHLRLASDIVLLSENQTPLQFMIDTLYIASNQVGVEIN